METSVSSRGGVERGNPSVVSNGDWNEVQPHSKAKPRPDIGGYNYDTTFSKSTASSIHAIPPPGSVQKNTVNGLGSQWDVSPSVQEAQHYGYPGQSQREDPRMGHGRPLGGVKNQWDRPEDPFFMKPKMNRYPRMESSRDDRRQSPDEEDLFWEFERRRPLADYSNRAFREPRTARHSSAYRTHADFDVDYQYALNPGREPQELDRRYQREDPRRAEAPLQPYRALTTIPSGFERSDWTNHFPKQRDAQQHYNVDSYHNHTYVHRNMTYEARRTSPGQPPNSRRDDLPYRNLPSMKSTYGYESRPGSSDSLGDSFGVVAPKMERIKVPPVIRSDEEDNGWPSEDVNGVSKPPPPGFSAVRQRKDSLADPGWDQSDETPPALHHRPPFDSDSSLLDMNSSDKAEWGQDNSILRDAEECDIEEMEQTATVFSTVTSDSFEPSLENADGFAVEEKEMADEAYTESLIVSSAIATEMVVFDEKEPSVREQYESTVTEVIETATTRLKVHHAENHPNSVVTVKEDTRVVTESSVAVIEEVEKVTKDSLLVAADHVAMESHEEVVKIVEEIVTNCFDRIENDLESEQRVEKTVIEPKLVEKTAENADIEDIATAMVNKNDPETAVGTVPNGETKTESESCVNAENMSTLTLNGPNEPKSMYTNEWKAYVHLFPRSYSSSYVSDAGWHPLMTRLAQHQRGGRVCSVGIKIPGGPTLEIPLHEVLVVFLFVL